MDIPEDQIPAHVRARILTEQIMFGGRKPFTKQNGEQLKTLYKRREDALKLDPSINTAWIDMQINQLEMQWEEQMEMEQYYSSLHDC